MARVAAQAPLSTTSLFYGDDRLKIGNQLKRKTPSELRGEQLKREDSAGLANDSIAPLSGCRKNFSGEIYGIKKPDLSKIPKYIDTRMHDIFPVRKPTYRQKMLSGKATEMENILNAQNAIQNNRDFPSSFTCKSQNIFIRSETSVPSPEVFQDCLVSTCNTAEKISQNAFYNVEEGDVKDHVASSELYEENVSNCGQTTGKNFQTTFRSVAELSSVHEKSYCLEAADMGKALKGLAPQAPTSHFPVHSFELFGDSAIAVNVCSEFHIPNGMIPLDFTLKTTIWIFSRTSVNWFHRLITCSAYDSLTQFSSQVDCPDKHNISSTKVSKSISLHSWLYPQSSLPPAMISALTLCSADGVEMDFLRKRQSAWEDSFRSLYYMLRKNVCNLFYVCTSQFVVVFTVARSLGKTKHPCHAYLSRSTRGLRSLLREHDIGYSMPLCQSKVEQVSTEDLVELSEIEKHNLGQTRRPGSLDDVDNTSESLLAFTGNENVHGLYDFLLNYRSFLTSLSGMDVPALYSPVSFQNAALCRPEVRCREMRSADDVASSHKGGDLKADTCDQSVGLCHSIEIRDAYIPPWIISNMCAVMASEGKDFEASFISEPSSAGLNVALETVCPKSNPASKERDDSKDTLGIKGVFISPFLLSTVLKGIKYADNSYTAYLSPV